MESSEEQKRIIQDKNNIVVTARPGSGKTYTIVEKIQLILLLKKKKTKSFMD